MPSKVTMRRAPGAHSATMYFEPLTSADVEAQTDAALAENAGSQQSPELQQAKAASAAGKSKGKK